MSCGVGHRHGLDPELLWLWHRLAAASLIQSLARDLPYAAGAALKSKKKKKKKRNLSKVTLSLAAECNSYSLSTEAVPGIAVDIRNHRRPIASSPPQSSPPRWGAWSTSTKASMKQHTFL